MLNVILPILFTFGLVCYSMKPANLPTTTRSTFDGSGTHFACICMTPPLSSISTWMLCKPRLVIPFFRNLFFVPKKAFLTGFLRIFLFSCVFLRNFLEECGFGVVAGIPFFPRIYRNLQEFLWDKNFCIYSSFLRIPEDS